MLQTFSTWNPAGDSASAQEQHPAVQEAEEAGMEDAVHDVSDDSEHHSTAVSPSAESIRQGILEVSVPIMEQTHHQATQLA